MNPNDQNPNDKTWTVSKVTSGTLNDYAFLKVKADQRDYVDLVRRLQETELPETINLKIYPDKKETAQRAVRNIYQWFWRRFGEKYLRAHSYEQDDGWWVVVYRGENWYDPSLMHNKSKIKPRREK